MAVTGVLVLAILLQLAAAGFALRPVGTTGRRAPWALIAVALVLMALRWTLTLFELLTSPTSVPPDLPTELLALVFSALLLAGVVGLSPAVVAARHLAQTEHDDRERFRVTLTSIGDAVIVTDEAGRVTFLNPVAEALTGWPGGEAAGRPLEEIFPIINEHTRQRVESPAARVLREGTVVGLADHTVLLAKDGRETPIDDSGAPIRNAEGRVTGVVLVFRDVTERRAAEAAQRQQQERLRQFVEHTPAAVAMLDRNMRYLVYSRRWVVDLGLGDDDLRGRSHYEVFPNLPDRWKGVHRRCLAGAVERADEEPFQRPDGQTEWVRWEVRPWHDDRGEVGGLIIFSEVITERKRAQQSVREQADVLNGILAATVDHVYVVDRHGRYKHVSAGGARVLGYEPDALTGKHWRELGLSADVMVRFDAQRDRVLQSGRPVREEIVFRTPEGEDVHFEYVAAPIAGHDGRPAEAVVVVSRDVTEPRKARAALEETERRFRQLAEHITDVFWMADPRTSELLYVSPAYERVFGRSCGSLYADPRSFAEAVHPDDRPRLASALERQGRGEATAEEYRVVCPDGSVRWVWDRGFPIKDDSGAVVRVAGIAEDITERKLADEAVRESEARLRRIVQSSVVGLIVADFTGRIHEANDEFLRMVGYTRDDLRAGRLSFLDLTPPEYRTLDARAMEEMTRTGKHAPYEKEYARKDGGRVPVLVGTAYLGRDRQGNELGVGFLLDLTGRKQAEQAVRESEQRFRGLMEQAPFSVQVFSPDGRIVRVNRAWEELWGVTPDRVAEYNVLHDPQLEAKGVLPFIHRAFAGEPVHVPAVRYDPNDTIPDRTRHADPVRWVSAVAYPLKDDAGRVREVVLVHEDITARKRAEGELLAVQRELEARVADRTAELARTNEFLKALLENVQDGIVACNADGVLTLFNRATREFHGLPEEPIPADEWAEHYDLYRADGRTPMAGDEVPLFRALQGEQIRNVEMVIAPKGGPARTLLASGRAFYDGRGQKLGAVVSMHDITHRKRAEDELRKAHEGLERRVEERTEALARASASLRESEEKFRLLADTIPQLAWTARPDGHIVWYNRRWYEYTGTTPEQMEGWGWQSVHDPDVLPKVLERWQGSIATGDPFEMVFPLKGADGRFRPFLTRVNPLRGDGGRILYWFGTNTDISEQKRAEADARFLAEAGVTLAGLVDFESTLQKVARLAVPHFADWCTVDILGEGEALRRVAVAHVDPSKVELAHELQRRFPPDPAAPKGVWSIVRTGKPEIIPEIADDLLVATVKDADLLRIMRELGLLSYMGVPLTVRGRVLGVVTFIAAESGRRYAPNDLAVAEDLARRAAVAIENAQLYSELREADRRKDEFLATLAHELRNPLAPIRNSLQILKMPAADRGIIDRARAMMERQVQQLVRLVDDLLDVSRVMRGKVELRKERVELAGVVARAVETAQPVIDAQGHELIISLPPEPLMLDADPVRLTQVVGNLLNNAAKYTQREGLIRLTAARGGGQAVLRVADNGIGIAPEMLPKVFGLFVQVENSVSRSQGGLGIGLTLVKSLVEKHGGTVEARSEGLGRGSEFVVRLPLAGMEVGSEGRELVAEGEVATGGAPNRRVLVVDDNVDAAESLGLLLRLSGSDVRVAHDGPSALQIAASFRPDIVFLDIGMPGMDGYEVARRLRRGPTPDGVLLVALTGWGQESDRRRTAEAGFDLHLVKPVEPGAVEEVLTHPKLSTETEPGAGA